MLKKLIYTISYTLILVTPSLAVSNTVAEIRTDIAIIVGIGTLTIIAALFEMLFEVANKGKIKLYIGILSTLMVFMFVVGYFVRAFLAILKASKMW